MKCVLLITSLVLLRMPALALDREAFTFTDYHLDIRIEPEQQRIGVRGKITLRNDSTSPQNHLALQISSSLHWSSIQIAGDPVEFIAQTYTSDIDHTGALSEAIVTLPQEIRPMGSVMLDIGYEGTIGLDTTRLERIGVPKEIAKHNDWDEIGKSFTGVRGVGYVAWYPVAMEAVSLSDGNRMLETIDRWKQRHAECGMQIRYESTLPDPIFFSGTPVLFTTLSDKPIAKTGVFSILHFGINVPTFASGKFESISAGTTSVNYFEGQEAVARAYSNKLGMGDPIMRIGNGVGQLNVVALPDSADSSFISDGIVLLPLVPTIKTETELTLVYALARQLVGSPRPWIKDGLAHYAQAFRVEEQQGRQAALDYLSAHRTVLLDTEKAAAQDSATSNESLQAAHSLINSPDNVYLQTKAMNVWWMLRDMLGNFTGAFLAYKAQEDKDPSYMQHLLEKQSHKDLEWFFDDWVYRDRGLPDFRVASAYPRKLIGGGYMVTVTVENLGSAGAEVPIIMKIEGGEIRKRLEVRAKTKASIRIEAATAPQEIIVNDGSVPESETSNNIYKVELPEALITPGLPQPENPAIRDRK